MRRSSPAFLLLMSSLAAFIGACREDAVPNGSAASAPAAHTDHPSPSTAGTVDAHALAHGVAYARVGTGAEAAGLQFERVTARDGAAVLQYGGAGAALEFTLAPLEPGNGVRLAAFSLGLADGTLYVSPAGDECDMRVDLAMRELFAASVTCDLVDDRGSSVSVTVSTVAATGPAVAHASPGGGWTSGHADLSTSAADAGTTDDRLDFVGTDSPDGTYTRVSFAGPARGLDVYIGGHHGQEEGEFHSTNFETDLNTAAVILPDGAMYVPTDGGVCDLSMVYVDDAALAGGIVCRDLAALGGAGVGRISAAGTVVAFHAG